jgi:hypothetical protein
LKRRRAGQRVEIVAGIDQPGDGLRRKLGPKRHDDVLRSDPLAAHRYDAGFGVDVLDLAVHDLDPFAESAQVGASRRPSSDQP